MPSASTLALNCAFSRLRRDRSEPFEGPTAPIIGSCGNNGDDGTGRGGGLCGIDRLGHGFREGYVGSVPDKELGVGGTYLLTPSWACALVRSKLTMLRPNLRAFTLGVVLRALASSSSRTLISMPTWPFVYCVRRISSSQGLRYLI